MFCLIKKYADSFKDALVSGKISPDELVKMDTPTRTKYLSQFVGEFNSKNVNSLFESKLLLKNQQRGIISWANSVSGLDQATKKDIVDTVTKLERAFNPKEGDTILNGIIEKRLGVSVTADEAKTITELANSAKELFDPSKSIREQSRDYWVIRQRLDEYVRDIKTPVPPEFIKQVGHVATDVVGVQRAFKTAFDLSAPLRQGRAYLGTKEWNNAFARMFKYAKSPTALADLEVNMLAHKYSQEALKNKHTLGLTMLGVKPNQQEEAFVGKLVSKIPALKGSERAYVGFLNDLRFNRFVNQIDSIEKSGRSILGNDKALKNLAEVIAASSGRGSLGKLEQAAPALAQAIFSPRWIASRFEMLTNPLLKSGPARKEAATSLARLAGTSAAIIGAYKMAGGEAETDPRSSNFGKIKIGSSWLDVTGGMAPYISLIARGITLETKSATTGKLYKLNTGKFGSRTYFDTATDFITNRASPVGSVIRDIARGESFEGDEVKLELSQDFAEYLGEQLFIPLMASDVIDAFEESSGNLLEAAILSGGSLFGAGVTTFK
jgi:hypothetical protein